MATYQQGDYISQINPTEPNLAFDAQILQTKQTKYDANHKKVSELYGSLLNANMSRNQNVEARDEFFKTINTDIKKMAGMDFSLESNVQAAAGVFQSIYNNKNIVKDMVWTKNFQQEFSNGQALKDCLDPEKCGGQWWEQGDKYMQYKLDEFRNASNDEAMGFENVAYVPYTNMTEKAMKYFKDNKLGITTNSLEGNYMVTTTNGEQAINPLSQMFGELYGNDPKFVQQYKAMAYVNRKDSIRNLMAETGVDEKTATSEYFNKIGTTQQKQIDQMLDNANSDEEYIKGRMSVLEEKLKTNKFGAESSVAKEYQKLQALLPSAQQAASYIKSAKDTALNANNGSYVRRVGEAYDERSAAILMNQEIQGVAKTIASTTMEQKVEADDFAKMKVKHSYDLSLESVKQNNRLALETKKAELENEYEIDPFGNKVKKSSKLAGQTVSGYIANAYKKTKDPKDITGDYEKEFTKAEVAFKNNETSENNVDDLYNKMMYWKTLNEESVLRKTANALDKAGVTNELGVTFSELNKTDRKLTGRSYDDYKKQNSQSIGQFREDTYSKSLGQVYSYINEKQITDVESSSKYTPEMLDKADPNMINSMVDQIKFGSVLSRQQKNYYDKVSQPGYILTSKDKQNITRRLNQSVAAIEADIKPSEGGNIIPKDVNYNTLNYIVENSTDENTVAKYRSLINNKKGLTVDQINDAAGEYNRLLKTTNSMKKTGDFSTSNTSPYKAYKELYQYLYTNLDEASQTINKNYISELPANTPEEKAILSFAYNYASKHGNGKHANMLIHQVEKGAVTREQLNTLLDSQPGLSKALYENVISAAVKKPQRSLKMLNKKEVLNAIDTFDDLKDDFRVTQKSKSENHQAIVTKMGESKDRFDFGFKPDFVKNGFLISQSDFIKSFNKRIYSEEDLKEEYVKYNRAYIDAVNSTFTEKINNRGYKSRGIGAINVPVFESSNVNPKIISKASNELVGFIDNFQQVSSSSRKIFVKPPSGPVTELSQDKDLLQKTISDLVNSNEFYDIRYQVNGINENKTDYENLDTANTDLTWEGMNIIKEDGTVIFMASDPKVRASFSYKQRTIPLKQRLLDLNGESVVHRGDEYTNDQPVIAFINEKDKIQLKGVIHVNGQNQDINKYVGDNIPDFTDVGQAESYVNDLIEYVKKLN